jgi:prefoldin subunit 5
VAYGAPDAPPSPEQEVEMLKNDAEWLKEQLNAIDQRMDELNQE